MKSAGDYLGWLEILDNKSFLGGGGGGGAVKLIVKWCDFV